jgi:uncharacterized protein (DUF2141 family)
VHWRTRTAILAVGVLIATAASRSAAAAGGTADTATLEIRVIGIRAPAGVIRLALCPPNVAFPDCGAKAVRTQVLEIEGGGARTVLKGLAPGSYAVSVFHDANGNGRLDRFAGIPREGYGFSNNPAFRPRAPRFAEGEIVVAGATRAKVRLRYLL